MNKKLYAFDVDHTLSVSRGPIRLPTVWELRQAGNIVGLCGNWAMVTYAIPNWSDLFSFLGPLGLTKADFLRQIEEYVPASEYVMVGNEGTVPGHSQDSEAARLAGWRFIREDDFAAGVR